MPFLSARTSFAVAGRRIVREGDVVDASDPVVKGREALFEPVEDVAARNVEQATAAPGEKRNVSKAPAKKAAPSKGD